MEYFELEFDTHHLHKDTLDIIKQYEPSTRTYAVNYKPTDLTVWNKLAVNKEILYGTIIKNKEIKELSYHITIHNHNPPYG